MATGQATIKNSAGIHVRPSGEIVQTIKDYAGTILLSAHGMSIKLSGVMGLIAMGLQHGDIVQITVDGPDDVAVCRQVVDLFQKDFDYPPRDGS